MIETMPCLGSARVLSADGDYAQTDRGRARLALAVPYRPVPGDEVLVIGQDELFVVGLLRAQGDVRLEAPRGKIIIAAGEGVEIEAPKVAVRAGVFDLSAHRVLEKVGDAFRWVSGLFQVRARRSKILTESDMELKAGSATIRAEGTVRVDGESIHLG